jgi:capsular polysaccharide biosynthesis protein
LFRRIWFKLRRSSREVIELVLANSPWTLKVLRQIRIKLYELHALKNARKLKKNGRLYDLKNINDLSLGKNNLKRVLATSVLQDMEFPRFLNRIEMNFNSPSFSYFTRPINYYLINNCDLITRSEIIISGDTLFLPQGYQEHRDFLPIQSSGNMLILENSSQVLVSVQATRFFYDEAINLTGSLTGNYAHWILEFLPKLIQFDVLNIDRSIPILVDDWIHPRFIESIHFFNKNKREIVFVPKYSNITCGKVHHIDNLSYVPPIDRGFHELGIRPEPDYSRYEFSKLGLDNVREFDYGSMMTTNQNVFDRIFIKRTLRSSGNGRQLKNSINLERIATEAGFHIVDPATLSFAQQVTLFKNAKTVISPVGAAMINLLFCDAGCKILALAPRFEDGDYFYFTLLASLLEHDLRYLVGDPKPKNSTNINADFWIDEDEFKLVLKTFLLV